MRRSIVSRKTERNITIDLIKGMGIILMVVRHARAPYSEIILLFHMAIFFIASGYLYDGSKIKDIRSLKDFIIKKIKGLWVPQFFFSVLFVILNNLFIQLNVYTDAPEYLVANGAEITYRRLAVHYNLLDIAKQIIKAVFFQCQTQVGGALWFFQTLFIVLVMYAGVDFILNRIKNQKAIGIIKGFIAVILLFMGYYCSLNGMMLRGISRAFSVFILLYIGEHLRCFKRYTDRVNSSVYKEIFLSVISIAILLIAHSYGEIDLSSNSIENPLFFLVVSLVGWFLMYSIASVILRLNGKLPSAISYISMHSVSIIALHFLCFKIVNVIAVFATSQKMYMVASFPVLMYSGIWWIAYTVVGIGTPLLINLVFWKAVNISRQIIANEKGR